jgi:hypothetical protein
MVHQFLQDLSRHLFEMISIQGLMRLLFLKQQNRIWHKIALQ